MPIIERPFVLDQSFRDPVHNFIRLSREEKEVVDTQVVQRLRRIHQLGPGYLVYHGAEHSRFGHALGTMEVATKIFEAIEVKRPGALGDTKRNWQLVRLAALLHDVGHAPFSHATEDVMPVDPDTRQPLRHERYTIEIIRSNDELGQAIQRNFGSLGITPDMVAAVIDSPAELGPEGVVLHQIVSGELDADRMDYLARDSLYTGASYGKYDMGRLLDTVTVAKWNGELPWLLAVEAGGVHALEQFLYARYFMYLQVYLHDGRRFFDFALNRFLQGLLLGGRYPNPSDLGKYLTYDDQFISERAREEASGSNEWAKAIWERKPWKTIEETEPHPQSTRVRSWSRAQGRMEAEFTEGILFDDAEAQAYQRIEFGPYTLQAADEEGRYPILVVKEGTENGVPVEQRSTMVKNLAENIMLMRIYARPDRFQEIEARWRQYYG